jgi:uncharacterized protein DUF4129
MSALVIDRDDAYEAAQRELAKPIYPKASLTERIFDWLDEWLSRLIVKGSSVPGGWLTIAALLIVLTVAVVVAVRVARRTMRTSRRGEDPLFGVHELRAAEHRSAAEQYAATGTWAAAVRHRLRAVARQLEEDAVLQPLPGRTATELATDAGARAPDLADEFVRAAEVFNDVAYGDRPGTESGYRLIADLDDRLRSRRPTTVTHTGQAVAQGWAQVQ